MIYYPKPDPHFNTFLENRIRTIQDRLSKKNEKLRVNLLFSGSYIMQQELLRFSKLSKG